MVKLTFFQCYFKEMIKRKKLMKKIDWQASELKKR